MLTIYQHGAIFYFVWEKSILKTHQSEAHVYISSYQNILLNYRNYMLYSGGGTVLTGCLKKRLYIGIN